MTAATLSNSPALPDWGSIKKIGPLGLIILAHVGLLYILQNGLAEHPIERAAAPREVIATFIQAEPTPAPVQEVPQPTPPKPKPVPVVKKAVKTPPKKLTPTPTPSPVQPAEQTPAVQAPVSQEPPAAAAPSAAPAVTTPAPPKVVTGVEYIKQPSPQYPAMSKRMGEEGKVMLRILVNEKGRPERVDIQKSSGSSRLDEAAKQAAFGSLFKPYMEDGRPIAVYAIVPIAFNLSK